MRLLTFVASVVFFAASGSAFAADCTKGLLWPFTRNPGDCLTDAEIKAGKTGVYNGPVNTNVDVSSIKPDAPIQKSEGGGGSTGGNTSGYFSGGLLGDVLSSGSSTSSTNAVSCNKGYLWPFLRDPGDCLTATEKLTNKTGVYRGDEVTKVSVSNASAGDAGTASAPANAPQPSVSSAPPACEKGWLWPFVRKSGDCPTGANKNEVYRGGEVTQVSAKNEPVGDAGAANTPASAPPQPTSSAPTCEKGLFWPFVRKSGDCPTDTDKK